jgi:hypothetical protein
MSQIRRHKKRMMPAPSGEATAPDRSGTGGDDFAGPQPHFAMFIPGRPWFNGFTF